MNGFNLEANSNDEEFFGALETSRPSLSQLFGITAKQKDDDSALKNKSPKQSLEASPPNAATPPTFWNVQLAKLVAAYNSTGPVGKLGMALLRNSMEEYKIVLYKAKNNIVATCMLLSRPVYVQQTYLQLYDDTQTYWSLLFQQRDDETEFLKALQVANVKIVKLEDKILPPAKPLEISNDSPCLETDTPENQKSVTPTSSPEAADKAENKNHLNTLVQKLPLFKITKNDLSDDSTDSEVANNSFSMTNKPPITPRNTTRMLTQKSQITSTVGVYNSSNVPLQFHETQFIQMMLTESRTQNTEMRINLSKLENKMEKVLDKIDVLASSCSINGKVRKSEEVLDLEDKFMELKKENVKLRQSAESGKSMTTQEDLNHFATLHESQLLCLELIPANTWPEVCEQLFKKAISLQTEVKQVRSKNAVLSQRLRDKMNKLAEQNTNLQEKQDHLDELTSELHELKNSLDMQQNGSIILEENMQELSHKLAVKQARQIADTKRVVKEIMNSLYSSIASQLTDLPGSLIDCDEVLSIIAKVIKYETLQAMQLN